MRIEHDGLGLDVAGALPFLADAALDQLAPRIAEVARELQGRRGPGSDFLGWLDLPIASAEKELVEIEASAARARADCDLYVVVGIGGSYLGARAVLEAVRPDPSGRAAGPEILFAGVDLCAVSLRRLLTRIAEREVRVCVISKSGTTLEPALAFRFLREALAERFGRREAARRITAITDARRGSLLTLAEQEGFERFVIPDDVGGRFSVFTPVGLLPLAVGGVDIRSLLTGAAAMRERCLEASLETNPAFLYAAVRYALHQQGFRTEILSSFDSRLPLFQEWWKQLFGESEGKMGRGLFPASALFTTDLHSLGQYIQDGPRDLMETFLSVRQAAPEVAVPLATEGDRDPDGLRYLEGRPLDDINWQAYLGTRTAHQQGGVPCVALEVQELDAPTVGGLIFLFEMAVAVGGRLLEVNPFDQPGVEAYKREVFNLLGKP